MRIHLRQSSRDNLDRWTSYVIDHGMKSSRSSSQLTDGGAAGGVAWLDEPVAFPFLSFLDLGSCTGGGTSCVGGHGLGGNEVIHVVIPVNTSWWLRCRSMTRRISGHLFLRRPSTITRRSSPPPSSSLRHKSTEDTHQFTKIWYRFVNKLRVLGVILAYN